MTADDHPSPAQRITKITAFTRPFAEWHDRYQAYYQHGLRLAADQLGAQFEVRTMSRLPRSLGLTRKLLDKGYLLKLPSGGQKLSSAIEATGRRLEGRSSQPGPLFDSGTGQYLVRFDDSATVKVCVDSMDYPALSSPELAAWSDVYCKTNWWPTTAYPFNVQPLFNCDPTILTKIPELRSARGSVKRYDVCLVVRVWGGRDGLEGVEHNIRLLEAVNRARCSKFVLAVLIVGDRQGYARRLERAGIPWTTKSIRPAELWRITAASRLNVLRLGMHDCIPWRMTGALAQGSCIVLDQEPRSCWPHPLLADTNFLDLGLQTDETASLESAAYDAVPAQVEDWLSDPTHAAEIRAHNETYFDRYLAPIRVGQHILELAGAARRSQTR